MAWLIILDGWNGMKPEGHDTTQWGGGQRPKKQ